MGLESFWVFIFVYCLFSVFLLVAGESRLPQKKVRNCTYAITIGTTCIEGAETSSPISIRFGDTSSNDVVVQHLNTKHVSKLDPLQPQVFDEMPKRPFQACMIDQFQVTTRCVDSPICYLYLKLAGNDDWRPGFAQVRAVDLRGSTRLSSDFFYFRRYLPRNVWHGYDVCDKEFTPFGAKHVRRVFARRS